MPGKSLNLENEIDTTSHLQKKLTLSLCCIIQAVLSPLAISHSCIVLSAEPLASTFLQLKWRQAVKVSPEIANNVITW
eukprot:m.133272 g.133272  ORF g.133272 m.133272 type:complete len:78 (+) comp38122_c0_seq1:1367-1600(+)